MTHVFDERQSSVTEISKEKFRKYFRFAGTLPATDKHSMRHNVSLQKDVDDERNIAER